MLETIVNKIIDTDPSAQNIIVLTKNIIVLTQNIIDTIIGTNPSARYDCQQDYRHGPESIASIIFRLDFSKITNDPRL